jgi:formylglycine-generating enzyme required for sulfatase activity
MRHPATVATFRLDKYEVTVGRFRQFVHAVVAGWRPVTGSGKHTHLNNGRGLNATDGGYEPGWDATNWNGLFATTQTGWTSNLQCDSTYQTWTSIPTLPDDGSVAINHEMWQNENLPINCETWQEAYAFCIWDGGFLPSEAEWNYAAGGGEGSGGQRVFPWSRPSKNTTIDCSYANYRDCPTKQKSRIAPNKVGSESPAGDGAYGQTDLAGNVWEGTLDTYATAYVTPCSDCVNLATGSLRVSRGGSFADDPVNLETSPRDRHAPSERRGDVGFRCARSLS